MDSGFKIVAVVGAGPAGLFAARELASHDVRVVLFNRDIKPGGLAEYGIYPDKYKMREGLRNQFRQVLSLEGVEYFGNVRVGENADLTLDDLRQLGFQAILVTTGAQGTHWLNIPGEHLLRAYHAKQLVYHYNKLPPFSKMDIQLGSKVAIIGAGNVMIDLAHYLIAECNVQEITAIARRGPAEVKFDKKELELVAANLDYSDLDLQIEQTAPLMRALGQDPEQAREFIHSALEKASPAPSDAHFRIRFLLSPVRILDDGAGGVGGLELQVNTLVASGDQIRAIGTDERQMLAVDTVLFAVGDQVDEEFGLPVSGGEYIRNESPRYPVDGLSYEVCDPAQHRSLEGIFVAGWSRKSSTGLVGVARKDGVNGAKAILQYLDGQSVPLDFKLDDLCNRIHSVQPYAVSKQDLIRLDVVEQAEAAARGLVEFKFGTNDEMLAAMGILAAVTANPDRSSKG
ncbi:MAG: FAD-dependent oxidoreductase [Anaerolineae bacterium]|nr:FAD-dependent oxidoreductase [Anaerolineae bacterium]